jgi:hypothetical protein
MARRRSFRGRDAGGAAMIGRIRPRRLTLVGPRTAVALAAGGALAAPATADAAQVTVRERCYVAGRPVPVSGIGFTPGARVSLTGDVSGSVVADSLGAFEAQVPAPANPTLRPRRFSVGATEEGDGAVSAPPVRFPVVREILAGNYASAISGPPGERTTWRFAGFTAGRPIFGHFRYRGRTVRTYRFGVARGVCGTLTTRAPRVPVTARRGRWQLQMDQARRFDPATEPRRLIVFRILIG